MSNPGAGRFDRRLRGCAAALATCVAAWLSGCTVPITAQTLTSGALNAGALLFVDRHNDGSGEGAYAYHTAVEADSLAAVFETAIADANRAYLFPRAAREEGHAAHASRPPGSGAVPARQWTPAPLFDVEPGSPVARGDTLVWVVTHRATRRVAFLLIPRRGSSATAIVITPYDPPAGAFLSVPSDHAQRNAVEALHQAFYLSAVKRLGPGVFVDGPEAGMP